MPNKKIDKSEFQIDRKNCVEKINALTFDRFQKQYLQ